MFEQISNEPIKRTEVFHRPNPFDLVVISATFDDREIQPPPRTYFPAINPEEQLASVTTDLQNAFGERLLFVGLTGSRVNNLGKIDADLDVLAIVDDDASADAVSFWGDLKVVSATGLREFIESGFQLVTTQFRKAQPIFEKPEVLKELRALRLIPEKTIPFLIAKSRFNEQTSDIFRLMSDKYRAIFFYQHGFQNEAFSQLRGDEQDHLFKTLNNTTNSESPTVYGMLAKYYSNLGLNRMFHSLSEKIQLLHIRESGDIADVEELVEWALNNIGNTGKLYEQIYQKRIACYKKGEILLDIEYANMREGIRRYNQLIENAILNKTSYEDRNDQSSSLK